MKVTIVSITDSEKDYKTLIQEYKKRLGKDVTLIDIKPERSGEINKIIQKDTDNIIRSIEKNDDYKILLTKGGEDLDTMQFKDIIKKYNNITFVIGGPYGLDEDKLSGFVNKKMSFGRITLPHLLAKTVLLEQIYRSKTILENKSYHY